MWFRKNKDQKQRQRELIIRYVELFIICIVTIVLILGIRNWYRNDLAYKNTIPVIQGTLSEIKPSEVETYVYENEKALLYLGSSQDETCRKLEKEFKSYILEKGLQDKITYLNLTKVANIDTYLSELSKMYGAKINIDTIPTIILFSDGKISAHTSNENEGLTLEGIKAFLKSNQIKGIKE